MKEIQKEYANYYPLRLHYIPDLLLIKRIYSNIPCGGYCQRFSKKDFLMEFGGIE